MTDDAFPAAGQRQRRGKRAQHRDETEEDASPGDDPHFRHAPEFREARREHRGRRRDRSRDHARADAAINAGDGRRQVGVLILHQFEPGHEMQGEVDAQPQKNDREHHGQQLEMPHCEHEPAETPGHADQQGAGGEQGHGYPPEDDQHEHGDGDERHNGGESRVPDGLHGLIGLNGGNTGHAPVKPVDSSLLEDPGHLATKPVKVLAHAGQIVVGGCEFNLNEIQESRFAGQWTPVRLRRLDKLKVDRLTPQRAEIGFEKTPQFVERLGAVGILRKA